KLLPVRPWHVGKVVERENRLVSVIADEPQKRLLGSNGNHFFVLAGRDVNRERLLAAGWRGIHSGLPGRKLTRAVCGDTGIRCNRGISAASRSVASQKQNDHPGNKCGHIRRRDATMMRHDTQLTKIRFS